MSQAILYRPATTLPRLNYLKMLREECCSSTGLLRKDPIEIPSEELLSHLKAPSSIAAVLLLEPPSNSQKQ